MYTPVHPSFTIQKWGVKGYSLHGLVFVMFKSSENIQKKECGPDRFVSDNQSSSATLNKLAMKARKSYCNFKFKQ